MPREKHVLERSSEGTLAQCAGGPKGKQMRGELKENSLLPPKRGQTTRRPKKQFSWRADERRGGERDVRSKEESHRGGAGGGG